MPLSSPWDRAADLSVGACIASVVLITGRVILTGDASAALFAGAVLTATVLFWAEWHAVIEEGRDHG